VRGVLERTRGDMTVAVRQEDMKAALRGLTQRLGLDGLEVSAAIGPTAADEDRAVA
jgi:hypothetical protein